MLRRIKDVIRYLAENTQCRYIVLVTTAKDALEKFSKVEKDWFCEYREQIADNLQSYPKFVGNWISKEVTVTGILQDPRHPSLASGKVNNAWEPFVWILDRIESAACHRRVFGKLKRFFITAAALGVVGAASFGSWYYWFDRETEREIGKLITANGMTLEKAVKDGKLSEINKGCGALEKGLEKLEGTRPFFRKNRERHAIAVEGVRRRIEGGRLAWYPGEMVRFEKEMTEIDAEKGLKLDDYRSQKDQLLDFDKKVKAFKVTIAEFTNRVPVVLETWQKSKNRIVAALEDGCCLGCRAKIKDAEDSVGELLKSQGSKEKLVECESLREARKTIADEYTNVDVAPEMKVKLSEILQGMTTVCSNLFVRIDGHNADVLKRRFAAYESDAPLKASEQTCKEWRQELEGWSPATSEGLDLKKDILTTFDQKNEAWRKAYETKQYENGRTSLLSRSVKVRQNLDDGDELKAVLMECRKYEQYATDEPALPQVDFGLRKSAWEEIRKVRAVLLAELLQSTVKRIDPAGDDVPKVSEDDSKFLSAVLKDESTMSEDEYHAWMGELNRKVEDVRKTWEAKQNAACDKFAAEIEGCRDACGALRKFATFYSEHPNAPKIKSVAERVDTVAAGTFSEIVRETVGYQAESLPGFDEVAMMSRKKRMNDTLGRLREMVQATAKVKILKEFTSGKFAEGCRSVGNVDGGVARAFRHRYEISRIDVQINYTDLQSNFKCVKVEAFVVSLDGQRGAFVLQDVGQCAELTKEDNHQWRTVWSGWATADGSPWLDALFSVKLTDVNTTWLAKDQSNEWRWKLIACHGSDQPYIEGVCELVTGRLTGDSKPKINVRIYVKETGEDFFDFVKRFNFTREN